MSTARKPGYDTLVYFWFTIALWCVGGVMSIVNVALMSTGSITITVTGLSVLGFAVLGCYLLATIFTVVVLHKCIAMLIYLVHKRG